MGFTDIRFDLIRHLPAGWRAYALLMRLDRPIGWWLLLLPGWWAIALAAGGLDGFTFHHWWLFILFFIGAILMRGAGCIINDLWDRKLDAKVERTKLRPLASGVVKPWQAVFFLGILLVISLAILLQMPRLTVLLGLASLVLIVAYPYMKRITWWPQAFLGITFNFGALMGWSAVTGDLSLPALLMYAGAFFWTLGYDTIYAHQDKEDDQMVGIKSTALLFGTRSRKYVGIFYGAAWGLIFLAAMLSEVGILSLGMLILPGLHMLLQVLVWKIDSPASSLRWFRSNRECGLLFLLSFLVSGI